MLEIECKFPGACVSVFRIAFQCSENDLLHLDGDIRVDLGRWNGIVYQAVIHYGEWVWPVKRCMVRQHLVKNDTEPINVAAAVTASPLNLLRRNIIGRAEGV